MTESEQRVYAWVAQYLADHGWPPTVREIQAGLHYGSPSTVQVHLGTLRAEGYLSGAGRRLRLGWKAA